MPLRDAVDLLEVRSVAADLLVEMTGVTKDFPGVHALADASFELRRGEVHALVGENGAGKSTLMKILAGIYRPDAGVIRVAGREVAVSTPREAQDLGISIVHQELNLMAHLTVAQNIFIGREPRGRFPFVLDDAALNRKAAGLFERLRLKLDPRIKVSDLAVAQQQMVEIAKALSFDSQVLIMDEPTAALTDSEVDELFRVIRDLRAQGVGIVHISHRLEELKLISDRVTVMRDGRYIATMPTTEAPIGTIINLMVGRTMYEEARATPEAQKEEIVLEVRSLNRGRMVRDINLNAFASLDFGSPQGRIPLNETARLDELLEQPIKGPVPIHFDHKSLAFALPAVTHNALTDEDDEVPVTWAIERGHTRIGPHVRLGVNEEQSAPNDFTA